jgi:hypothetical protein
MNALKDIVSLRQDHAIAGACDSPMFCVRIKGPRVAFEMV